MFSFKQRLVLIEAYGSTSQNNVLQKCYMSDSQLALHLCMTVALAILPPKNIINCFDQLCLLIRNEYLGDVDNKRDYFEETYIDRLSKSLWARTNKQQGRYLTYIVQENVSSTHPTL